MFGGQALKGERTDEGDRYACDICGEYIHAPRGVVSYAEAISDQLTNYQRALISHRARQSYEDGHIIELTIETFERLRKMVLPTPPQQATNLIAHIGNAQKKTGQQTHLGANLPAIAGAVDREAAARVVEELISLGLLIGDGPQSPIHLAGRPYIVTLTFAGWERYEAERAAKLTAHYGFLAMGYGNDDLEGFVKNTLKPHVKESLDTRWKICATDLKRA